MVVEMGVVGDEVLSSDTAAFPPLVLGKSLVVLPGREFGKGMVPCQMVYG